MNEHEFNKAKPLYKSALKSSGFNYSMKFEAPVENAKRNRNRKVIWFNPPYSLNVKTNIGKVFLKLVRKHFPRSHKLSKIFNLNTIKISYSSMPNVKNLIKQHNSKILNKDPDKTQRPCNCRIKEICPLNGKCLHQCKVYKEEVSTNTIPPIKNTMEHQRGSSNQDTIIIHNLSETYLILMTRNYPNTFGR